MDYNEHHKWWTEIDTEAKNNQTDYQTMAGRQGGLGVLREQLKELYACI